VRRVALIALLILILVITAGAALLWRAGELRTLAPHFAGHCTVVPMAANATDIRVDPNRHVAYLSYLDTRGTLAGKHTHGTVMLLDLTAVEPHLRAALVADPADRPAAQRSQLSTFMSELFQQTANLGLTTRMVDGKS